MEELELEMERVLPDQIGASDLNRMLVSAVKDGNLDFIRQLLDAGADVNCEVSGETPLGESKDGNVARFLISRGAKVSLQLHGRHTLWLGVLLCRKLNDISSLDIVKVFLENGASVTERGMWGRTPLIVAARQENSVEVLQLLLDHGADINDKDNDGKTALFEAIHGNYFINVSFLLELYKEKNISINLKNHEGLTPLMTAVVYNHPEIVKQLIEFGADVNFKDENGNTPLLYVHTDDYKTSREILTTLITAGSDVNCQNNDGYSPLMRAAEFMHADGIRILLESGADVNAVSEKDSTKTALSFLCYCGADYSDFEDCFQVFLEKGATFSYIDPCILHMMTREKNIKFICKLVSLGLGPMDVKSESVVPEFASNEQVPAISPLCVALLEGDASLARCYIVNMFLTNSDTTTRRWNLISPFVPKRKQYQDCQIVLDELTSQPWSLFQLAFVSVLSAVGSSPGREKKVDMLPLPQVMKDKLLFTQLNSELKFMCD